MIVKTHYAANDPLDKSDPSGRQFDTVSLAVASTIVGVLGGLGDYYFHRDVSHAVGVGIFVALASFVFPSAAAGATTAGAVLAEGTSATGTARIVAYGATASGTVIQFEDRVGGSISDQGVEDAATTVLRDLAEMSAENPEAEMVERELEQYKTSDLTLDQILDLGNKIQPGDKVSGMLTLARVQSRVWQLLADETTVSALEARPGQLKFWITVDCTLSRLLGYPPTLQIVRVGSESVQC